MNEPASGEPFSDEFARDDIARNRLPLRMRLTSLRRRSFSAIVALLVAATLVLIALAVFVVPELIVASPSASDLSPLEPVEKLQAEVSVATAQNAVRTTLIQAIAGGLFFVTAFVAWQQVRTARQGQATDRFTKSIEQLGDEKTDVRLGGIYALQQMSELEAFRRPVAEILAAYLRTHADATTPTHSADLGQRSATPLSSLEVQRRHQPDMQAVLRILVHNALWYRADAGLLDLSFVSVPGADLRGAELGNALLRQMDLSSADLRNAELRQADARGADFRNANMTGCDLNNTLLEHAIMGHADLSRARMSDVRAAGADLRGARLTGADLAGADLTKADLRGATLNGAALTDAVLLGANLAGANMFELGDLTGLQVDGPLQLSEIKTDERTRRLLFGLTDG